MKKQDFEILLFYKYVAIEDPIALRNKQKVICDKLGLKGRIIVAKEGINGTVEGKKADVEAYIKSVIKDYRLKNIDFKRSKGTGNAFPKLSVKARSEIVAARLGKDDVNPSQLTGKYLTAEQLH